MRRFPPPWTVEAIDAGFKVIDANGQALAYVYGYANPRDAGIETDSEQEGSRGFWAIHKITNMG
jgi:hypothetical protein